MKSVGLLSKESETVLEPKGVLERMNVTESVMKNFQTSAKIAEQMKPVMGMIGNISPLLGVASRAAQASSMLSLVSGSTAPLLSNQ
ncbi:hypothetical protein DEAC_c40450 [Desulfosporosinus acididurans]|uniref:Uncharacterized protein n=1 Tax=Desulfosporosinus acididurans TaxID=476652 RepID=A0A0J1IHB3_9FIRM|nr:hypothetical protein DEAC_c40450 [Desulfosporosinus acididurans]